MTVIEGDRRLPPGFRHPHASEEARSIAEAGLARVPRGIDDERHEIEFELERGEIELAEAVEAVAEAELRLEALREGSSVPERPDRTWVDE